MHAKRRFASLSVGLIAGAAIAMPLAASDPPAKAREQHGGHAQPAPAPGGRWNHDGHDGARHPGEQHGHGSATAPSGPEIAFRGCAYFESVNFAGRRGEIRDGASAEWLGRGWSDRISSTACHPGCRMIGYSDINYGGARRNFSGAIADLGAGWNDRISALRAVCDGASAESH